MQDLPPNVEPYPFKPLRRIEFTKMSQTWLAATRAAAQTSQQHVVLKIARRDQTENFRSNQAAITNEERWLRKLQSTANHPGLVRLLPIELIGNRPIYSAKTHDPGEPWFIVVDYLAGGSLKDALARQSAVHPRVALQIARQLAVTLAFVHQEGCVHLDLKPDNVMFAKAIALNSESLADSPVLIDFGIAKPVREQHYLGGVAAWLAPECVRAMDKHERIPILPSMDIYALGLVLNCLLTEQHPGTSKTLALVDSKALRKKGDLKARRSEQLATGLNALIAAMTNKNAGRRPTAQQVVVQLDHLLVGMSIPKRKARPGRLMSWTLAGASAVMVLLLGALVFAQISTNSSAGALGVGDVDGTAIAGASTSSAAMTDTVTNAFFAGSDFGEADDASAVAGPIAAMTATASATDTLTNSGTLTDTGTLTSASTGSNTDALTDAQSLATADAPSALTDTDGASAADITTTDGVTSNTTTSDATTSDATTSDATTSDATTSDAVSVSDSLTATTAAALSATTAPSATEEITETPAPSTTTSATPGPDDEARADEDDSAAGEEAESPNRAITPSPQPTATRVSLPTVAPTLPPTETPVPPAVAAPPAGPPPNPTVAPAAPPAAPAANPNNPGEPLPDRAVALLAPADGVDLAGRVEFSWGYDFELGSNERFEPVFWQAESNRDVSALGLAAASQSSLVLVDLDAYRQQSPDLLEPGALYRWGVRITDGEGRPLQWVSGGNAFKYVGD